MSDTRPGRGSDQFPLRFPDGMRDYLKAEAAKNGRSLNAEIIARLQLSIEKQYNQRAILAHHKKLHGQELEDKAEIINLSDEATILLNRVEEIIKKMRLET